MYEKTIFSGFGGQGVLMMGYVFAVSAMKEGRNVTYLPSYGAEVRGGTANCTVVVADEEIFSPVVSSPDYAVIMNKPSLIKYEGMIKVPANDIAKELGSDRTINMIMLGAFVGKTKITTLDSIMNGLTEIVKGKKASLMKLNRKGLDKGAGCVLKGV